MTEEDSLECPDCGEKTIVKPRIYYGVFRETRQPDGVCGECGAFYWKRPEKTIPSTTLKPEEQKPEKFDWFKTFVEQEEERKRKKRRKRRFYPQKSRA